MRLKKKKREGKKTTTTTTTTTTRGRKGAQRRDGRPTRSPAEVKVFRVEEKEEGGRSEEITQERNRGAPKKKKKEREKKKINQPGAPSSRFRPRRIERRSKKTKTKKEKKTEEKQQRFTCVRQYGEYMIRRWEECGACSSRMEARRGAALQSLAVPFRFSHSMPPLQQPYCNPA